MTLAQRKMFFTFVVMCISIPLAFMGFHMMGITYKQFLGLITILWSTNIGQLKYHHIYPEDN